MILFLTRTYFPDGTNGRHECEGKFICYTIELPWKQNEARVSCIPEGEYFIRKRFSSTFQWHLEVMDVKSSNLILFRPATTAMRALMGCIAPVTKVCGAGKGLLSRKAFSPLKALVYTALKHQESVSLIVCSCSPLGGKAKEVEDLKN